MAVKEDFDNWPGCPKCKHFKVKNAAPIYSCAAFPRGIPILYKSGSVPHIDPAPSQRNSIVFEPVDE